MMSIIYSDSNLTESYETLDIHDLTTGWVQLPKIYPLDTFVEGEDWPEQLRVLDDDAECPICKLQLNEDSDEEREGGTFAIIPSTCCDQPFHSLCLSDWLKDRKGTGDCPLCRETWSAQTVAGMIAMRAAQMEDVEKGWKSGTGRRRFLET
jgi:hypothetical protein